MANPIIDRLVKLCKTEETFIKARALWKTAELKTGPGSGYSIGDAAVGLPAICAFIASQQLRNNDVKEIVAQSASCLNAKSWKTTLRTVRNALAATSTPRDAEVSQASYEEVERTISHSGQLRGIPNNTVTTAVFYWGCGRLNIRELKGVKGAALQKSYKVPREDMRLVYDIIESTCDVIARDVKQEFRERQEKRTTRSGGNAAGGFAGPTPISTPSKSPPKSPTKSALRSGSSLASSPTKTPTNKRKVAFTSATSDAGDGLYRDYDGDGAVEATPSKRQKFSSPTRQSSDFSAFQKALATPTRSVFPPSAPAASTSKTTLELLLLQSATSQNTDSEHASTNDIDHEDDSQDLGDVLKKSTDGPLTEPEDEASTDTDEPNPFTPRPSRQAVQLVATTSNHKQNADTPKQRTHGAMTSEKDMEDDEHVVHRKRCRPVLLGLNQWGLRDPRVKKQWELAERWKKNMVERRGHPFERMRLLALEGQAES
ncbi:hypothetical protein EW026_g878 [Hermanssonia centrifuga]|uniref:Uncharacterized protein n=1 Tax=Hermanssonia centrifuga TaxID=98765 RepID=A0A4S4KTC4_9APHY|nr:hypothetical protein EW026_g878 [Hermanssonia centrifuga]